jgi:NADH dehydrogenase
MISPEPAVAIRPRLYEASLDGMNPDISALLGAVGVRHLAGLVEAIDTAARQVTAVLAGGERQTLAYDRFVLAAGSQLYRPEVPGLAQYAFDADQFASAQALDAHIKALAGNPKSAARNTVVVAGGGFTGLETATEMPERLRAVLGDESAVRVILVDSAGEVGAAMGASALPFVREALAEAGVETRGGVRVATIDTEGVTLSSGERIAAHTVVWTAGMRASPLAAQIPGEHDEIGRVVGDAWLRAPGAAGVFVTGDTVKAATDDAGNFSAMSCQHALSLGRVAGHNAAAELLGLPLHPYSQPKYVTCLDLGPWGALYTEGWDRQVTLTRAEGKALKREINTKWIYPPAPDRDAVFAVANPDYVIVP